jgi:hypothetical protein
MIGRSRACLAQMLHNKPVMWCKRSCDGASASRRGGHLSLDTWRRRLGFAGNKAASLSGFAMAAAAVGGGVAAAIAAKKSSSVMVAHASSHDHAVDWLKVAGAIRDDLPVVSVEGLALCARAIVLTDLVRSRFAQLC